MRSGVHSSIVFYRARKGGGTFVKPSVYNGGTQKKFRFFGSFIGVLTRAVQIAKTTNISKSFFVPPPPPPLQTLSYTNAPAPLRAL